MRKDTRIRDLKTFVSISLGIHLLCFSIAALVSKDFQVLPLRTMPLEVTFFLPTSQAIAEDRSPVKIVQLSPEKIPREKEREPGGSPSQEELQRNTSDPQLVALFPPVDEETTVGQEVAKQSSFETLIGVDHVRDEEKGIEIAEEKEVIGTPPSPEIPIEVAPSFSKKDSSSEENLPPAVSFIQTSSLGQRAISESKTQEGSTKLAKAGPPAVETNPLILPRYLSNPKPLYPAEARKKGYYGNVMLRVEVLPDGQVGHIELQKSSGYDVLDRSALGAVRHWRFLPAKKGESHVSSWVQIPIKFQLE